MILLVCGQNAPRARAQAPPPVEDASGLYYTSYTIIYYIIIYYTILPYYFTTTVLQHKTILYCIPAVALLLGRLAHASGTRGRRPG